MALYISRHAGLSLPIRATTPHYHPTSGVVIKVDPAVSVQFYHAGTVPEYAHEAVSKMGDWGTGIGRDENPFDWCGIFDLDEAALRNGWSPEDKALVEEILDKGAGTLYVRADPPRIPAPWPNYDKIVGEDADVAFAVTRKVQEDGYSPSDVAAYESQGLARPLVLEALASLEPAGDEVVGIVNA